MDVCGITPSAWFLSHHHKRRGAERFWPNQEKLLKSRAANGYYRYINGRLIALILVCAELSNSF